MPNAADDAVTIRLGPEQRDKLALLARDAARSPADLINEAMTATLWGTAPSASAY